MSNRDTGGFAEYVKSVIDPEPKKHPIEPEVRKYLEMLPEPYRTEAIENAERLEAYLTWEKCGSSHNIARAVTCAFIWSQSTQDAFYWSNIADRANAGEFDPQPVETRIPFDIARYDSGDFLRYETRDGRTPENVYVRNDRSVMWPMVVVMDTDTYSATIEGSYVNGQDEYSRDLFMVIKGGEE